MTDGPRSPTASRVLVLFGLAACLGILALLTVAGIALSGGNHPLLVTSITAQRNAFMAALLSVYGFYGYRGYRRSLRVRASGERPDPYWVFRPVRVGGSLVGAIAALTVFALLTQAYVETVTAYGYAINWFETIPLLSLAIAWVLNGEWNRRAWEDTTAGASGESEQ